MYNIQIYNVPHNIEYTLERITHSKNQIKNNTFKQIIIHSLLLIIDGSMTQTKMTHYIIYNVYNIQKYHVLRNIEYTLKQITHSKIKIKNDTLKQTTIHSLLLIINGFMMQTEMTYHIKQNVWNIQKHGIPHNIEYTFKKKNTLTVAHHEWICPSITTHLLVLMKCVCVCTHD